MPRRKKEIVKPVKRTRFNNEPVKTCLNESCSLYGIEQPIEEFRRPCESGGLRTFRTCNTCEKADKERVENFLRQEAERVKRAMEARKKARKITYRPVYRSFNF